MKRIYLLATFLTATTLMSQRQARLLGSLPAEVAETSGLVFYNGRLVTHNDSGNEVRLYELDTVSLQLLRTISVGNTTNVDWEDIAQDDTYFYLGDIGNTFGDRQNLVVYRIAKTGFSSAEDVPAERIDFRYEDQTDFTSVGNSDWDAEALLVAGDQLLIFTKQWQSNGTKAYALSTSPGSHNATLLGSYYSNGLVTGATYNQETGVAYLCGYTQLLQPFLLRLDDFNAQAPFSGTVTRETLEIGPAQVEGITHTEAAGYLFSTEHFENQMPPVSLPASLYAFHTEDRPVVEVPTGEEPPGEIPEEGPDQGNRDGSETLRIFSSFGSTILQYELKRETPMYGRAVFDQLGRRILYTHANAIEGNSMDLSSLRSAVYYLTFYLQGETISKPFFLN